MNIKKIRAKASKKHNYYSSNRSISDSDSSLYSESEQYKRRHPTELTDRNKLDHVVKNKNINKDQCNDAIEYEPRFDSKFSLSSGAKNPLKVVTVSLRGGKKKGQP